MRSLVKRKDKQLMTIKYGKAQSAFNSDGSPRICPRCNCGINLGEQIKFVPRVYKAHHNACEFARSNASDARSDTNTQASAENVSNANSAQVKASPAASLESMIRVARETVTDATSNIIDIAEKHVDDQVWTKLQQ